MCPEHAHVLIVEDDPETVALERIMLERFGGHSVVGVIQTFQELPSVLAALSVIPHAALVDMHLTRDHAAKEGSAISGELRRRFPDIAILGTSLEPAAYADYNLGKPVKVGELLKVITSL